jgi:hypothetical protein
LTKHTILFLAANPLGTDRLALDREARAIQLELERSGCRDFFDFETRWAMEPLDLLRDLRKLRPTVVHYSGHGGSNGLFFQTADGRAQVVSTAALAELYSVPWLESNRGRLIEP